MADGTKPGTLHLIATPIGNLEDLSFRALRTLEACELIAAEDTRRTRKLLTHYGVSRPLVSYYEHNETKRIPAILDALRGGKDVALVSDAGSPGISDPGERVVQAAIAAGLRVEPVPGPSALVAALTASGLPTEEFHFIGFLPHKSGQRRRVLERLKDVPGTLVLYESPYRIEKLLFELKETFADRQVVLARELTKKFEELVRLPLADAAAWLDADANRERGEFVLVLGPRAQGDDARDAGLRVLDVLLDALPTLSAREAARLAARITGAPRNALYAHALARAAQADDGGAA